MVCWKYRLTIPSTGQIVEAYSYDTFDLGMPVAAWIEIKRGRDEKHVMRTYNVVTKIREIRPGPGDPKLLN